ncbi:type II secretion system protein [Bacillaceae bacterium W0354]
MRVKNDKGVTLVELLAVLVILAIIALIAVPAITGVINDSRVNSIKSSAINTINAAELYMTTKDVDSPSSITYDKLDKYINDEGVTWESSPTFGGVAGNITITGTAKIKDTEHKLTFTKATITLINKTDVDLGETIDGSTP